MIILGIYEGHDASACILKDGKIIVHIEKERLSREKHDMGNVSECVDYCLKVAKVSLRDIDYVATSRIVADKAERTLDILSGREYDEYTHPYFSEHTFKIFGEEKRWCSIMHHLCHGASSYYLSWYSDSAVLAMDGGGDFTATMIMEWNGGKLYPKSIHETNLWSAWSAFCTTIWLNTAGTAWTLMALGTLGTPRYVDRIYHWGWPTEFFSLSYKKDKQKALDQIYKGGYLFHKFATWWKGNHKFEDSAGVFHGIDEFDFVDKENHLSASTLDVATSLQQVTDEIVEHYWRRSLEEIGSGNLCYSGWVALNCVTNARVRRRLGLRDVFIPPFCNDAGLSIWAALYLYYHILDNAYSPERLEGCYFWKTYETNDIRSALEDFSHYCEFEFLWKDVFRRTARILKEGNIVAWYQDGCESWPRALGNRSILCNPWFPNMKRILNEKVKHRESYRPFAPSVLEEKASEWFDGAYRSPFMLDAFHFVPWKWEEAPAVMHLDGSARVQTVSKTGNSKYHELITEFNELTGIPMLLDTSFNDREPIVETPQDALKTFLGTEIDFLVIGEFLVRKRQYAPIR